MIRPNFEFSSPTLEIESIADISTDLDLQNIAKAELEVKKYIDTQELYSLFCNEDIMLALRKFIVMISADGKFKKPISHPDHIAVYPTASSKAGRIIYGTPEGKLIVTELSVN